MAVEQLTDAALLHPEGIDSPAMQRLAPVTGAHTLPGGMNRQDAFAIDPEGAPYDIAHEFDDMLAGNESGDFMSENELLTLLESEEHDAVDFISATVAQDRTDAIDYFFGRPFGNEEDGRSEAVATEVFDAVQTLLPPIIKPFISTDDTLAFEPESAEDADAAEQETAYTQYQFMRRNNGFGVLYKWIHDGLLQKNGVVKYWWDETQESKIERYFGITQDVLEMVLMQDGAEIIDGTYYPAPRQPQPAAQAMSMGQHPAMQPQGPQPMQGPPGGDPGQPMQAPNPQLQAPGPMLYDVKIRLKGKAQGYAHVENVPPEEFLISRDAVDCNPKLARFCEHRRMISLSDLREQLPGVEISDDLGSTGGGGDIADIRGTPEFMARHADDSLVGMVDGAQSGPNRMVLAREMYPHVDWDGDGIAELRKIIVVGREILINEEVEEAPFCGWTPYIIPHKYFGVSVADISMDFQLQKSAVQRQLFDNVYGINNNRSLISKKVSWEDMLTNVVDGFVRVNAESVEGHYQSMAPVPLVDALLPVIQYMDQQKENRLGYSRNSKGMSANSINRDPVTATEVDAAVDSSLERTQLISRVFAECGLKPLIISLHGLIRRHGNAPDTFRMTHKWVTVDPRYWKNRRNMTVSVGLGTGDKSSDLAFWMQFAQLQQQSAQAGMAGPEEFYNTGKRILNLRGEKNVPLFLKDPANSPPPAPQKPESVQVQEMANQGLMQMEQIKQAGALAIAQENNRAKQAIEVAKGQAGMQTHAADNRVDQAHAAIDAGHLQLDAQQARHSQAIDYKQLAIEVAKILQAGHEGAQNRAAAQQAAHA